MCWFLGCPGNSLSTQKACNAHAHTRKFFSQRQGNLFMRCFISHVVWKPKTIPRSLRRSTCLAQVGPQRSTGGALFASCLRACLIKKSDDLRPRPCLLEQAKLTTDTKGLTAQRRPCSDASVAVRICVIAKRLGFLH